MAQKLECVGIIFQFNKDGVLFEFSSDSEEDMVGIVMPYNIRINKNGDTIPKEANTSELLLKYIQAGDQLHCTVELKSDLPRNIYEEEEDKVGSDGKINQNIEVEPRWLATSAELITSQMVQSNDFTDLKEKANSFNINNSFSTKNQTVPPKGSEIYEEVGVLEEQLSEMFDHDEEDIPNFEETKSENSPKPEQLSTSIEENTETQKIQSNKIHTQNVQSNKDQTQNVQLKNYVMVRLVQLVKPDGSKESPVLCGIFEILSGRFSKIKVTVPNSAMYAWGHHLGKANLIHVLKHGDICTLEYTIVEVKHSDDLDECSTLLAEKSLEYPIIKTLFLYGPTITKPVKSKRSFFSWLKDRAITETDFLQWVNNQLPPKVYFPFPVDFYHSEVIGFVRGETGFNAIGIFLEIKEVFGECNSTLTNTKTQESEDPKVADDINQNLKMGTIEEVKSNPNPNIALLFSEDLYVCGVNVAHLDLRHILKIGDPVVCQIHNINNTKWKKKISHVPQPNQAVTHITFLGYVGEPCPTQPDMKSSSSTNLNEYLKIKGISIDEFEEMRNPVKKNVLISLPQDFHPQGPLSEIENAANLAARSLNLTSTDYFKIKNILVTDEDIDTAVKVTKVLTHALIFKMEATKQKIQSGLPTVEELRSQCHKVDEAQREISYSKKVQEKLLKEAEAVKAAAERKSQLIEDRKKRHEKAAKEVEAAKAAKEVEADKAAKEVEAAKAAKEVEAAKAAKEVEAAKAAAQQKSKSIIGDMKYVNKKAAYKKQEASPLQLLREYTRKKKFIKTKQDKIWFGDIGFPKSTKVNIKIGSENDYYTLGTLKHFLIYRPTELNHIKYLWNAENMGLTGVTAADAEPIMKYLTGSTYTLNNLVNITHRELNPQLFQDTTPGIDSKEITIEESLPVGLNQASPTIKEITTKNLRKEKNLKRIWYSIHQRREKKSRFDQTIQTGFYLTRPNHGFSQSLQNFAQNIPQQSQGFSQCSQLFQPIQCDQNQVENYASHQVPKYENNLQESSNNASPVGISNTSREKYEAHNSPTFERIQGVNPQLQERIVSGSPTFRNNPRPDLIDRNKYFNDLSKIGAYNTSTSPPPSQASFDFKIQDPSFIQTERTIQKQYNIEHEWENLQRTKEAKLRFEEEEEELLRLRKVQEQQTRLMEIRSKLSKARDQKRKEEEERRRRMSLEQTRSAAQTLCEDDWEVEQRRIELEMHRKENRLGEVAAKQTRLSHALQFGPGSSPERIVQQYPWEEARHSRLSLDVNQSEALSHLFEQPRRDYPSEMNNKTQSDLSVVSQWNQGKMHHTTNFEDRKQRQYF